MKDVKRFAVVLRIICIIGGYAKRIVFTSGGAFADGIAKVAAQDIRRIKAEKLRGINYGVIAQNAGLVVGNGNPKRGGGAGGVGDARRDHSDQFRGRGSHGYLHKYLKNLGSGADKRAGGLSVTAEG